MKKTPAVHRVLNNRFSLTIAPHWWDGTVHVIEGPEEDGIQHNITLVIDNDVGVGKVEDYAGTRIDIIEKQLQGYRELKRGNIVLNNDLAAHELVYKWYPAEGKEYICRVIFVTRNGTGYTMRTVFTRRSWKNMGPEIDRIMKSFTIPQNQDQESGPESR